MERAPKRRRVIPQTADAVIELEDSQAGSSSQPQLMSNSASSKASLWPNIFAFDLMVKNKLEKAIEAAQTKKKGIPKPSFVARSFVNIRAPAAAAVKPNSFRLSPEVYECRKSNHFCYRCGESKPLPESVEIEEEQPCTYLIIEGELEQEVIVAMCMNVLTGDNRGVNTILVRSTIRNRKLTLLIDSGITHCFIDVITVKEIGYQARHCPHVRMTVADGNYVMCTSICIGYQWKMQGRPFQEDLLIIPLKGCDMVIGNDWKKKHNPTNFDHEKMCVTIGKKEPKSLPSVRTLDHTIPLKPGAIASQSEALQHSQSPFSSPTLLVKKKYRTWRFYVDYRGLNDITVKDKYPIPIVDYILDELSGSVIFSKNEETNLAFTTLKRTTSSTPVLALPDYTKEFIVETDASQSGIGAVLMQKGRPVAYFSKEIAHSYEGDTKATELISQAAMTLQGPNIWHYTSSILRRKEKIYICTSGGLKTQLISIFHDSLNKDDNTTYPGLLPPLPIPNQSWSHISMDFREGLPKSKNKEVILVVVDRMTKYAHFIAFSHSYTTTTIADVFWKKIHCLHGTPESIVTDKDKSDSQTERVNKCLENYLRCMTASRPIQWKQWLTVEWWYNTNFHTSLQCTPFEALYGYSPPQLSLGPLLETMVQATEDTMMRRQQMQQLLKDNLTKAQERMKYYADKRRSDREFQVGDMVYLKLQPYRQTSLALRRNLKLRSKYYGPYKILARIDSFAYKLDLSPEFKVHPMFHVSLLKKKIGDRVVVQTTLPITGKDGQFLVKPVAILQRQLIKMNNAVVVRVLVQWSNLPLKDTTWEDYQFIKAKFPNFGSNP
ncbi:uncharacterized protein [Nicotiana sylvestris]|uniref:uncharacterized protein n=1 Tax=Nicotiana sylvestris TaxID=4096 RepID=UPI00388C9609